MQLEVEQVLTAGVVVFVGRIDQIALDLDGDQVASALLGEAEVLLGLLIGHAAAHAVPVDLVLLADLAALTVELDGGAVFLDQGAGHPVFAGHGHGLSGSVGGADGEADVLGGHRS